MSRLVILFDIDGTLIRSQGAGKAAIKMALTSAFELDDPNVELDFAGRTDLSIVKELFLSHSLHLTEDNIKKFLKAYLGFLEDAMSQCQGRVLPGVIPLLDSLARQGKAVTALLTGNIRQGAFIKLKHFGLDRYFTAGGFGDTEEERAAIARSGLEEIAKQYSMEVDPNNVVIVGDTPADVRCAKLIGAHSLAVCTGYSERRDIEDANPDWIYSDLTDLFSIHGIFQRIMSQR